MILGKIPAAVIALLLVQQPALSAAYKCDTTSGIEYSDRPCPGGQQMRFDPAPPVPQPEPRRLVIIDKSSHETYRYSKRQRARLWASARALKRRNTAIRAEIAGLQQRKEQELANASLTHPERMAAINLYWNGRIDALEREYDRNLNQINRLEDMSRQP